MLKFSAKRLLNMNFLRHQAMHLLHGSIEHTGIVQLQQLPHVTPNSGTDGLRHPAKTDRSQNKK